MGLSQALSPAMSGLRATQASLSPVSSTAANAETPGSARKTLNRDTGTTALGRRRRTSAVKTLTNPKICTQ